MPSGKTHEKINLRLMQAAVLAGLCAALFALYGKSALALCAALAAGYCAGTYYLSPDLDTVSKPYLRWGPLRFFWRPYQRAFKHRSFWTHAPVAGDAGRALYLLTPLYAAAGIACWLFGISFGAYNAALFEAFWANKEAVGAVFAGLCAASLMHGIADAVGSAAKRRRRKREAAKKTRQTARQSK